MALVTFGDIQRKLTDIRKRKDAQKRIVEDLERPLKVLREIEAEEAEAAAEEARFNEHVAHLRSRYLTRKQWVDDWSVYEADMPGTIKLLEAIEDGRVMSTASGFTQWGVNHVKSGFILTLQGLTEGRQELAELEREAKKLGIVLEVKE